MKRYSKPVKVGDLAKIILEQIKKESEKNKKTKPNN